MSQTTLDILTDGPGLYEFTDRAQACVGESAAAAGVLVVFVRHTSCSLLVQENVDPSVRTDLDAFFKRLVPPADDPSMLFLSHRLEGVDDMPAHIKSALTAASLTIPFAAGRLVLGPWQGIYLWEHRRTPHRREVVLQTIAG